MLFFASDLSPERMQLLDKKYATVPLQVRMVAYDMFRNQADSIEWVLRHYKTHPEFFGDIKNMGDLKNAIQDWRNRVLWWEKAQKLRDPRISQHPEWNPARKWDLGAYGPGQLDALKRRFPEPVRPRELVTSHAPPVKLISREEKPDGVWEVVQIDGTGVAKQEYVKQIKDFRFQASETLNQAGLIPDSCLEIHPRYLYLNIRPYFAKFYMSPGAVSATDIIQQDILTPAKKAGWVVQTVPTNQVPYYRLFAPALLKYIQALCRYGEGSNWCTTQPDNAVPYLFSAPIYIVLHDGYAVTQATKDEDYVEIKSRDNEDEERGQNLDLLRTHAGIQTVSWASVEDFIDQLSQNTPVLNPYDFAPDWLDTGWIGELLVDSHLEEMEYDVQHIQTKINDISSPEGNKYVKVFLELSDLTDPVPEHLESIVDDLLANKKPQGDAQDITDALLWLKTQREFMSGALDSWLNVVNDIREKQETIQSSITNLKDYADQSNYAALIGEAQSIEAFDDTGVFSNLEERIRDAAFPQ